MEKRMDENLSKSLSDYLSHRPPVKEQKSLALMRRVHRLHEKIGRLSISASPSHNPSPSTSQEPSTSTSQDVKLKGLKDKLGLREEQLLESLLDKDILALRKCLKDTQTERELDDQCFSSLKAASDHLEKPFRDIVESARKGDFSGPAVQRMMLLVHQYAEKVRQLELEWQEWTRRMHGPDVNLGSYSTLALGSDSDVDLTLDSDSDSDSDS